MMRLSTSAASVALAWNPSTDSSVVGYKIYYGSASGVYTNAISAGNATNITISGLVERVTYYFAATAYNTNGLESSFSSETSYLVPRTIATTNHPPTLDAIGNLSLYENAGPQTVSLSGITSGATNENQTLFVTAFSSNTGLIPNPTVNYTSPHTNGSLTLTPATNACGAAAITVTVNDGGASNNIVTRTFTVIINSTNGSPTLDPISNMVVNAGVMQTVPLSGISPGTTNANRRLLVTATANNTRLVSHIRVQYFSTTVSGVLNFWPGPSTGTATVSVTVNNRASSNNIITRTFTVTVVPRDASTNLVASISGNAVAGNNPVVTHLPGGAKDASVPTVAAKLTPAIQVGGQFVLSVAGAARHKYVIEASTDLVHWVPVATNTAPFTFVDSQANQFPQRFYRSVAAP